mgnify:CR=1 FL=1
MTEVKSMQLQEIQHQFFFQNTAANSKTEKFQVCTDVRFKDTEVVLFPNNNHYFVSKVLKKYTREVTICINDFKCNKIMHETLSPYSELIPY